MVSTSRRVLTEALAIAPERLFFLNQRARLALNAHAYETAHTLAARAYHLEPTYRESALLYAAALLYAGDVERSDEILMQHFGTIFLAHDSIIEAQIETGLEDRALTTLRESVAQKPERKHHWELLLEIYERRGDRTQYEETLHALTQFGRATSE